MSLRSYLFGIFIGTVSCLAAFLLIIFLVNPEEASLLEFSLMFVSLFFVVAGIMTLISFYLRRLFTHNESYYSNVRVSLRQGLIFGLGFTGLALLQMIRLLTWWDGILLFLLVIILEFYFKSSK